MEQTQKSQSQVYVPVCKPNQLIVGGGTTIIVTGWTPIKAIGKELSRDQYGAIGQLYSPTRGISFLIRNILANPFVRSILILAATKADKNAGGGQCLYDFFQRGVRDRADPTQPWTIDSDVEGYIAAEIDRESLELIRANVSAFLFEDRNELLGLAKQFTEGDRVPWAEPKLFDIPVVMPTVLPGPQYVHRIEAPTIADAWVKIIHRIKTMGVIRPTGYDGQWQELINLVTVVTDEPTDFYFPEPNFLPCDRASIQNDYVTQILDDAPYEDDVKYTYGQRLRSWFWEDQIEQVIKKLIGEIDAASAVMSLWDVKDHVTGGSPCLNHIWVRVVRNELSMTATFRSNDMYSAWPSNAMGLRALQRHICEQIGARSQHSLTLGPLITVSQSAHIYDDCWPDAGQLIADHYFDHPPGYDDPSGNFIITVEGHEIVVEQTTPGSGTPVRHYRGRHPLAVGRDIVQHNPAMQPDHALYLGAELEKAAQTIGGHYVYIQDQPLKSKGQRRSSIKGQHNERTAN